ncbi:MAG: hypothetical protein MUE83_05750 [Tabrizicola sp.]|nr:hypothetical protein [Tabrizicola sp.]
MSQVKGDITAAAIYQANLDAVSTALWTADLQLALQHLALPNQTVTADAEYVMTSPDDVHIILTEFLAGLRAMGADNYLRVCRSARFMTANEDMIVGEHDTFLLREGQLLRPPYLNIMTLIRSVDGRWLGCRIEAAERNTAVPIISPDMAVAQQRDLQSRFHSIPGSLLRREKE